MKSKMIVRVISHDKRKEITEQATIKRFEDKKKQNEEEFHIRTAGNTSERRVRLQADSYSEIKKRFLSCL